MKVSFGDKKRKYAAVSHNKIRYQEKQVCNFKVPGPETDLTTVQKQIFLFCFDKSH